MRSVLRRSMMPAKGIAVAGLEFVDGEGDVEVNRVEDLLVGASHVCAFGGGQGGGHEDPVRGVAGRGERGITGVQRLFVVGEECSDLIVVGRHVRSVSLDGIHSIPFHGI